MSHGAIDMFSFTADFLSRPTPLSIAVEQGHDDIFRLIMDNIDTFVPVPELKQQGVYKRAYRSAYHENRLEAFLKLVRLQRMMTPERAFVEAAMVDEASAMVEGVMGSIDVQADNCLSIYASGDTVGEQALYLATKKLRPQNVMVLLRRGCRLPDNATVQWHALPSEQGESVQAQRQSVVDMLAEFGCTVTITP